MEQLWTTGWLLLSLQGLAGPGAHLFDHGWWGGLAGSPGGQRRNGEPEGPRENALRLSPPYSDPAGLETGLFHDS